MTRRVFTSALLVVMGLVGSPITLPARAQSPPVITWEPLGWPSGNGPDFFDLALKPGAAGDTLYGAFSTLYRRPPGGPWSGNIKPPGHDAYVVVVTSRGDLLVAANAGGIRIARSLDGGRTWNERTDNPSSFCLFERPSDGTLLACGQGGTGAQGIFASTDRGLRWTSRGLVVDAGTTPRALAEHPTAGPGGTPRLVVAAQNGMAYSDDGAATWTRSNVWAPFRWFMTHVVAAPGGRLYAAGVDFGSGGTVVFASDDGGATWAERLRFNGGFPALVMGADGAVYLGTDRVVGDGVSAGEMYRSGDGGATWAEVAAAGVNGYGGACVRAVESGSDGRLYVAGCAGVWRTAAPLVVAGEVGPAEAPRGVAVTVRPNPASGRVAVVLTAAEAVEARVTVVDALGREVAFLLDGPLPAGERTVEVETGTWPAGTYVVHAATARGAASARLVVAR